MPSGHGRAIDTTPLRMETDQLVLHVFENGSTRSHLSIHHPQPRLDGHGIQVSRLWLGLKEGLAHLHWDLLSIAVSQVEPTLKQYEN